MTMLKRFPWKIFLSTAWLVFLVYLIISQWPTVDLIGDSWRLLTPTWIIVAILAQILLLFSFSAGLRKSLKVNQVIISQLKIFVLSLESIALNTIIPGGLAGSLLIAKRVTPIKKSLVPNLIIILTAQVIDLVLFIILVLLTTGKLFHLSWVTALTIICLLGITIYVIFIYYRLQHWLARLFLNRLVKLTNRLGFKVQLIDFRKIIISTIKNFSLPAMLIYILNIGIVYSVVIAFGIKLTPVAVLSLYTAISVVHVISPVPQGIGLVEGSFASILALYGVSFDLALAIAVTYRIITFWLPMLLGTYFYFHKKAFNLARHRLAVLGLASLMFMVAIINLLSSLEKPLHAHIHQLVGFVPFKIIPYGRFASVVTGLVLLLLIQGILRRKKSIYYVAVLAAGVSGLAHLVKGLNYAESGLSFVLLGWLFLLKDQFTVDFDRSTLRNRLISLISALVFLLVYGWLGIFRLSQSFEINHSLLISLKTLPAVMFGPKLAQSRFAHDFVNSWQILAAAVLILVIWLLLKPVTDELSGFSFKQKRARKIISHYGNSSLAELCLYPDKRWWFSQDGSVISYVLSGRVAVVLGDPIGPDNNCIEQWYKLCQRNDWISAFYQTNLSNEAKYLSLNYHRFDVGREALIDCSRFNLVGSEVKSIRNAVNSVKRNGYTFKISLPPLSDKLLNDMQKISTTWLQKMGGDEKHFSLGWFDQSFLKYNPVGLVYNDQSEIVAFASLLPRYKAGGWAIDLIRYGKIKNGVIELLLVGIIDWVKNQTRPTLSLGLSPLSGVGNKLDSPPAEKVAKQIFLRMKRGYNFSGLWNFKNRFQPDWEPRYLWYAGGGNLPRVITAIIAANAGGSLIGYLPFSKLFNKK